MRLLNQAAGRDIRQSPKSVVFQLEEPVRHGSNGATILVGLIGWMRGSIDERMVQVVRSTYKSGAIEPPGPHSFDVVIVPLTAGNMRVEIAGKTVGWKVGEPIFISRGTEHSVANRGETAVDQSIRSDSRSGSRTPFWSLPLSNPPADSARTVMFTLPARSARFAMAFHAENN
jgi:quercetin dioxygenase-like cupin family protein